MSQRWGSQSVLLAPGGIPGPSAACGGGRPSVGARAAEGAWGGSSTGSPRVPVSLVVTQPECPHPPLPPCTRPAISVQIHFLRETCPDWPVRSNTGTPTHAHTHAGFPPQCPCSVNSTGPFRGSQTESGVAEACSGFCHRPHRELPLGPPPAAGRQAQVVPPGTFSRDASSCPTHGCLTCPLSGPRGLLMPLRSACVTPEHVSRQRRSEEFVPFSGFPFPQALRIEAKPHPRHVHVWTWPSFLPTPPRPAHSTSAASVPWSQGRSYAAFVLLSPTSVPQSHSLEAWRVGVHPGGRFILSVEGVSG